MKRQWWHNKVAYQIYPKSFYDSNGDGIGDLRGIITKLDYLRDLGVDILWLSPIYASPMADQGYDISDYYRIDPRFGTMEDMDELIAEAKRRGMYLVMDLVVNHCSDEHIWFQRACEDPDGTYGKYFYIETVKDGRLPCNWRSYFGGPVWDRLPGHEDKYYFHSFHKKQPDLNWENPELREEIYRMINWWLDKGLAGFRVDAIINIKKVLPFRDYPADREDGLCEMSRMLREVTGVGERLTELKECTFTPHGAFTVGEVCNEKPEELPDFIGEDGYFSSMFDFTETLFGRGQNGWHENLDILPDNYRDCLFFAQKKFGEVGYVSNVIENHDEPRGVNHYLPEDGRTPAGKKMLATIYFLAKGLPWIYQGQEIGMENVKLRSIDEVDDISAIGSYHTALRCGLTEEAALSSVEKYSRDNARTPFQWNAKAHAGFTSGTPWLRVNPNYTEINLEEQQADPESVFHYYKKLIALRKNPEYRETLVYGEFVPYLEDRHNVTAYFRKGSDQTILVLVNCQAQPQKMPLPDRRARKSSSGEQVSVLLSNFPEIEIEENTVYLQGYQTVVLLL